MTPLHAPIANDEGPDAELAAPLTIDAEELTVTDETLMPGAGDVSIMRVGDEILKITGAASGPYEIERGVDDTEPTAHTAGAGLAHVDTPEATRLLAEEFAIPGPQGEPGEQGLQGDQGPQGEPGPDDRLVGYDVPEFAITEDPETTDEGKGLLFRVVDDVTQWVKAKLADLAADNVFTGQNDFTEQVTNVERLAIPTDQIIEQQTVAFTTVGVDATAVQEFIQLPVGEAPPISDKRYGFYNSDTNEFWTGYVQGAISDRVTNVERGCFGSQKREMTAGQTIEVLQMGEYAVPLDFTYKPRQTINVASPTDDMGRAIEVILPDGQNDPNAYDGAMAFLADNTGALTQGAIIATDPNGGSVTITTRYGRIEALLGLSTGLWTLMASPQEVDPGLGVQRLTVRLATAGVLPFSPTYSNGVLTASSPGYASADGFNLAVGELVLVTKQAVPAQNGPYVVGRSDSGTNYQLRRVAWFDENTEVLPGAPFWVSEGNVNKNKSFILASDGPFTVGTTDLVFASLNGRDVRADFTSNAATGANTSETDLHSWTAPANFLQNTGDKIEAMFSGIFANNGNTKRLRIRYNNSVIFDTDVLTGNAAGAWVIEVTIMRVSSTSVRYSCRAHVGGVTVLAVPPTMAELNVTNHTATKVLKVTGQNGTGVANDIIARMSTVELAAAAV